ncbi:MAG TPA: hypothetical protein PLA68_16050 [Panacibacter sp.]|nr:hypothetical protein [Panacibacter sp.]
MRERYGRYDNDALMGDYFFDTSFNFSWHRLLCHSLVLSVFMATSKYTHRVLTVQAGVFTGKKKGENTINAGDY